MTKKLEDLLNIADDKPSQKSSAKAKQQLQIKTKLFVI